MNTLKQNLVKSCRNLTVGRVFQYIFIYALAIIVLLPIMNVFLSAFKSNVEIQRNLVFPSSFGFANFIKILKRSEFYTGMFNSIVITVGSLMLSTLLAAMAAYPLAKRKGKIYNFIYILFLSAQMIPAASNMVPLYSLFKKLHLMDTRIGMILVGASSLSMGILLFTSFIKTIATDLSEAAEIDGCNYMQAFFLIVLPMLKPVCITYMMSRVMNTWNDFLLPQLLLPSKHKQTITVLLYNFTGEMGSDWGAIFALMALSAIPPIIFFLCFQKYFFENISVGAVKG